MFNKCDLRATSCGAGELAVSARTGEGVEALKEALGHLVEKGSERKLLGDLLEAGDLVLLVAPIDASAPKGRLILPQVRAIRDILGRPRRLRRPFMPQELPAFLARAGRPRLVITDSQAFGTVKGMVPEDVPLTSFSILFARFKGVLESAVRGAEAVSALRDGDKVLICEAARTTRQCEDIGTVKLPGWIRRFYRRGAAVCVHLRRGLPGTTFLLTNSSSTAAAACSPSARGAIAAVSPPTAACPSPITERSSPT